MRSKIRPILLLVIAILGCSKASAPTDPDAAAPALGGAPVAHATGGYKFTVPEDFNGGIFGIEIDNHVTFNARRDAAGNVSGRFRYVQSAGGEDFIFQGRVTCLHVYDTPVLERFPGIPPMTANRAKWGGIIERSNDVTQPPGRFIWFQSIDNGESANGPPDLSTLSGFGDEAANEAFCTAPTVPNTNFGPHAVEEGNIQVH